MTIVLTSKCPSELRQEEDKLTQIIRAYSLSGIEVQFLEVESLFANGNDRVDVNTIPPAKSYITSNALCMGASVGIKNNPTSSGTIGGQIILSYGNKNHYFGVTNSHAVSIKKPGQGIYHLFCSMVAAKKTLIFIRDSRDSSIRKICFQCGNGLTL